MAQIPCQPSPLPRLPKPSSPSPPCFSSPSHPSFSLKGSSPSINNDQNQVLTHVPSASLPGLCVPIYSTTSQVIQKMRAEWGDGRAVAGEHPYRAMYSSLISGVILDPTLMVIPMDDHMVHRGHGVFDTTMLVNGYLYDLDSHLDRFLGSASSAKIIPPYSRETLKGILLLLAAASKLRTGSIRYWLSSGPGDFSVSPPSTARPAFYSVAMTTKFSRELEGVKVITSTIPAKPPKFATMKSVNYLPNALSKMEAEEKGAFSSISIDDQGYVAEGPNCNIAFISKERELILPKPDKILHGCTAKRLLVLASKLVEKGIIKGALTRDIAVEEAKASAEMMFVSSLIPIMPVVDWDGEPIGDGNVGEVTRAISDIFWEDIIAGPQMLRTKIMYN